MKFKRTKRLKKIIIALVRERTQYLLQMTTLSFITC